MLLIVIGKFAAFAKEIVISAFYGATSVTDSYFVASNVSTLIFAAFNSTISLVFLPLYNEKKILEGKF